MNHIEVALCRKDLLYFGYSDNGMKWEVLRLSYKSVAFVVEKDQSSCSPCCQRTRDTLTINHLLLDYVAIIHANQVKISSIGMKK